MDTRLLLLVAGSLWTLAACGGSVETRPGGSGGATATSGSTTRATGSVTTGPTGSGGNGAGTSSSSDATSASSGTGGCTTHADCPAEEVCLFQTGTCARTCEGELCDRCGADTVCDTCATSSCPGCDDCRAACAPAEPGQCDDDTPCEGGDVCMFGWSACYPPCDGNGGCPDPGFECVECATGSCCGCRNCVDVCLPLEG